MDTDSLATRKTFRGTKEKCRYGLDMGSFQGLDKFAVIADINSVIAKLFDTEVLT
jgi:hypothetical protein